MNECVEPQSSCDQIESVSHQDSAAVVIYSLMDNNDTICQTSPTLINVEQLCELANPTKDELPNKSPKENICFNESLPSVLNEDSLIDDLLPLEWFLNNTIY